MSTLKVDAIRSSGGSADGLTMDSSGRVLTPARPAFLAYDASSGHQELTHGSWQIVPFDTTSINTGGHYNTSTYRFTAPVAGLYFFYIQLYMDKAPWKLTFSYGRALQQDALSHWAKKSNKKTQDALIYRANMNHLSCLGKLT